jgi:ADP-heptose:LPS heptosyltransferase
MGRLFKLEAYVVYLLGIRWRPRRHLRIDDAETPRFLIVRLDQLGDLIMTMPLLSEIKRHYPGAHSTVLVQSSYVTLVERDPFADVVIGRLTYSNRFIPKALWPIISGFSTYKRYLKKYKYDVVISPRFSTDLHQATMIALLSNSAVSIGYRSTWQIANPFMHTLPGGGVKHELWRSLDTLTALGVEAQTPLLSLLTTAEDDLVAQMTLIGTDDDVLIVGLGLGSHVDETKRWPVERFALTVHAMKGDYRILPVVICTPAEVYLAEEFGRLWGDRMVIASNLTVPQAASLLRQCDIYIGNDSGGGHLAAATGIPVVTISSHAKSSDPCLPSNPDRFRPWTARGVVIMPEKPRFPCIDGCDAKAAHCILENEVAGVVEVALRSLALYGSAFARKGLQHNHGKAE